MSIMECKKVNILLDDYIKGQLMPEQLNEINTHITNCQSCSEAFNTYKEIMLFIEDDKQIAVDNDFFTSLENHIKVNELPQGNSIIRNTILYVAASVILIISIVGGHLIGNSIMEKPNDYTSELSLNDELFAEDLNMDIFNEQ